MCGIMVYARCNVMYNIQYCKIHATSADIVVRAYMALAWHLNTYIFVYMHIIICVHISIYIRTCMNDTRTHGAATVSRID